MNSVATGHILLVVAVAVTLGVVAAAGVTAAETTPFEQGATADLATDDADRVVADTGGSERDANPRRSRSHALPAPQVADVETTLEAEADRSEAAFDRPVTIDGELRTARGEPFANKQVDIQVGTRTYTPITDGEGGFTVSYRPVGVDANATSVDVTYLPDEGTRYTDATATVELSIRQVEANLSASVSPRRASLGRNLRMAGTASVGGRLVPDLPIAITVADSSVRTARTDTSGVVHANWSVPAEVPTGETTVVAEVAEANAAIAPASASTSFTVEETSTSIAADVSVGGDEVVVEGRLAPGAGAGDASLPGELPVTISVGEYTDTATTDADGRYSLSIPRSEIDSGGDEAIVRAAYAGDGTNLGPAMVERTVSLAEAPGLASYLQPAVLAVVAAVVAVAVGLLVLIVRRRRRRPDEPAPAAASVESDAAETADAPAATPDQQATGEADRRHESGDSKDVADDAEGTGPPESDAPPQDSGDEKTPPEPEQPHQADSGDGTVEQEPNVQPQESEAEPAVQPQATDADGAEDRAAEASPGRDGGEGETAEADADDENADREEGDPESADGEATDAVVTEKAEAELAEAEQAEAELTEVEQPEAERAAAEGAAAEGTGDGSDSSSEAETAASQWSVSDAEIHADDGGQRLADARGAIASGAIESGVASAYTTVHDHLTRELTLDGVMTPRELLAATDGRLDPAAHDALGALTDVYEETILSSEPADDAGRRAIAAAAVVLEADVDVHATETGDD